ncbi:MAG: NIL domain-containing protein [Candidatus Euphemobacter frigidus]|nr:NIL domain-containing protein [Candidatus Euphemobacter frigidus]MDP8275595.1 NIL domain-containing protein [Candidatus Euphemobacter frigidus]
MVELTMPKTYKDEPVFYEMIKRFEVVPTIIEASFSTDTGWAYIKLEGVEEEINKLFDFLKSKNIIVDIRS